MSESECSSECDGESKRKKKYLTKSESIKRAKVKGTSHTNYAGNVVPERKTGPPCRCPRKCFEVISEEDQLGILSSVNSFDDKTSQDTFLQGLIEIQEIKRERKCDTENPKVRQANFLYHVSNNGQRVRVCKSAFLSLHSIGEKHVRRLNHLLLVGSSPKDMRGKSEGSRHNLILGEICSLIKTHIESFPVYETHYANRKKKYLSATLDVKQMHDLFKQKHPGTKVNYKYYLKYFKENYDYKFGRPQIDVCSKCEELNQKIKSPHLNDGAKRVATAELIVHKTRAKKFYKKIDALKKLSMDRDDMCVIAIDYMQNLPLPHIPVQEVFYYRQLWVFEFCIVNLKNGQSTFFSYHEGEALKGPNEVCSFLNKYFIEIVPDNVIELHIFSDGCPGQNKNNTLIRYLLAMASSGRFEQIFHYFPVRGHSFLPCDRSFGTAKRLIRKRDRIYTPDDYNLLISMSSPKIEVIMVTGADIVDYKKWSSEHYKKKVLSKRSLARIPKDQKVSFQVSQFMEFEYSSQCPGDVIAYFWIDGIQKEEFSLAKIKGSSPRLPTSRAYLEKLPINDKKVEDIRKLMQYIPVDKMCFYNAILEWPTSTRPNNDTDEF